MYFWFGAVKRAHQILVKMPLNLRWWDASITDMDLVCARNNNL